MKLRRVLRRLVRGDATASLSLSGKCVLRSSWHVVLLCQLVFSCAPHHESHNPPPKRIDIAVPYEIDTLDPHEKNSLSNFALISHFYEPLVTTDANMRIGPGLAKSWETPDPLTWVFYLREDLHFHDGRQLGAKDVLFSLERVLNDPSLEMRGYLLNIETIKIRDAMTIELKTARPMSILLNKLRFIPIIPEGAQSEHLKTAEIGTGPYVLREWDRTRKVLRMQRNNRYWGDPPAIEEVNFYLARSAREIAPKLFRGQYHLVQYDHSKALEPELLSRMDIIRRDSLFLKYIGYDMARDETPFVYGLKKNPFKNKLVRQAIHLAIDRNALVSGLTNHAVAATQPLPPFIFGYNPAIRASRPNREIAKSLLNQAGFPDGFQATLHVRQIFSEAAYLVTQQLKEVGLRLDVQPLPDTEMLPALRDRKYSLYLSRIGCPTGDATDVLDNALHSADQDRRYGVMNFGGYSNPDVDAAIEQSAEVQDINNRQAVLQAIMTMVMEDLAWIPLYIDQNVYAVDKRFRWKPRSDSFILAAEIQIAQ